MCAEEGDRGKHEILKCGIIPSFLNFCEPPEFVHVLANKVFRIVYKRQQHMIGKQERTNPLPLPVGRAQIEATQSLSPLSQLFTRMLITRKVKGQ